MSTWQTGFVETNGVRLHYTRSGGDGRPLLLAHGITDNGRCYTRLVKAFEAYFDCIMVDARGHGESDKPDSGYCPRDHAADLAGVIATLHLNRPVAMGHSMGGAVVTQLAADYPDLLSAVVLEDPAWEWAGQTEPTPAQRADRRATWQKSNTERQNLSAAEIIAAGRMEHPTWAVEEFDAWSAAKLQVANQALDFVLCPRTDWQDLVAKFQVPALVLYGDQAKGSILGPDMGAVAQQVNPLVKALNIPGAGHNIRREQFETFAWAVREFLAKAGRLETVAA